MVRRPSVSAFFLFLFAVASAPWLMADEIGKKSQQDGKAGTQSESTKDYYELLRLFADTVDQVDRNYVKPVDRRELMEAAIRGVMSKLDPYSTYISPQEFDRFRNSIEAEFGGIGIQVTVENGQLKILSPLVGTPAYHAGLMAGDHIVQIHGESTDGITLDSAIRRMKGEVGSDVTITVVHAHDSSEQTVTVRRGIIHVQTVLGDQRKQDDTWDFLYDDQKKIGYIRISVFSRHTARDLRRALEDLKLQGLQALVLDLRFNPGGVLSSAVEVSDMFVPDGLIVSTAGRNTRERSWHAHKSGTYDAFPMAILVNHFSASASEIVSACLQDHARAVIVGERTWGKGSVQNVIELEDGKSALKLTTAGYKRPSGKNIHRFHKVNSQDEWGVTPNDGFELKLTNAETVQYLRYRRQRDILVSNRQLEDPVDEGTHGDEQSVDAGDTEGDTETDENADSEDAGASDGVQAKDEGVPEEDDGQPEFIDRQLQKALDYLSQQLATNE